MMFCKNSVFYVCLTIYGLMLPQIKSQELSLGSCPNFPTVKNFQLERVSNLNFNFINNILIFFTAFIIL